MDCANCGKKAYDLKVKVDYQEEPIFLCPHCNENEKVRSYVKIKNFTPAKDTKVSFWKYAVTILLIAVIWISVYFLFALIGLAPGYLFTLVVIPWIYRAIIRSFRINAANKENQNKLNEGQDKISKSTNKENEKAVGVEINGANTTNVLFCRKCGAKLHSDSEFCHSCGKAIIETNN